MRLLRAGTEAPEWRLHPRTFRFCRRKREHARKPHLHQELHNAGLCVGAGGVVRPFQEAAAALGHAHYHVLPRWQPQQLLLVRQRKPEHHSRSQLSATVWLVCELSSLQNTHKACCPAEVTAAASPKQLCWSRKRILFILADILQELQSIFAAPQHNRQHFRCGSFGPMSANRYNVQYAQTTSTILLLRCEPGRT